MIVVTGDKIAALGPIGSIAAPPGATVMDMAGAVVLPGFIDAHAHWNGGALKLGPPIFA
jgi:imidazolonepropionase-like amidohydrolase